MLKRWCFVVLLLFSFGMKAQVIDSLSFDSLHDAELRLTGLGVNMIQSYDESVRLLNAKQFLITLSRSLRIRNSYYYRFDSLNCASVIYAPDNRFRIITWNVALNEGTYHYFGVIQMSPEWMKKQKDTTGLRNIYPLIDRSARMENVQDTTLGQDHWYGATYYKIIPVTQGKTTYYTLLGWNGATALSNIKLADVLWFDHHVPKFGAPVFDIKDARFKRPLSRMIFEFNNTATMTLKFSEKKKYLIYEVLVPPRPQDYGHPETYLPDGTFEYLLLKKGIWEKQTGILRDFSIE